MTGYVEELKRFAELHARAQGVGARDVRDVLARVEHDDGERRGSWAAAWSTAGAQSAGRGRHLDAAARYGLARFPYVDGPARRAAHDSCVESFERWRGTATDSIRRTVELADGSFAYFASGLDAADGRALLIVIGGIVSAKEQWGPLLRLSRRIGMAVAVTELPGVGENALGYRPDSWMQLSALLDDVERVTGQAPNALVLGLSFGGHLALRCALDDERIRGVATVGAPIGTFFQPAERWSQIPLVTRRTLAHVTGIADDELPGQLPAWALGEAELRRLRIPVRYVASTRDEVIPATDVAALERHAPDVRVVRFDDVHGSPNHLAQTRAWLALSLLRMNGRRGIRPLALEAFLRLRGVAAGPA